MERTFPPPDADERAMLTGWLDWQRATVHRKLAGLAEEDAYRSLVSTSPGMTVAGVTSHLRWTEHSWFSGSFPSLADAGAPSADDPSGWEFARRPLEVLAREYDDECRRSRTVVAATGLEQVQEFTPPQFRPVTLRWILHHMIEETARHLGHLDILRELIDGERGY